MSDKKKPKYKVGDKVRIRKIRPGSTDDYRFGFADVMVRSYGGTVQKIACFSESGLRSARVPDDGFGYRLEGIGFTWASSMFEDVPSDSIKDSDEDSFCEDSSYDEKCLSDDLEAFIKKDKCPEFNFNL